MPAALSPAVRPATIALTLLLPLLSPQLLRGGTVNYTFRNVVDTSAGSAYTEVGLPKINNAGEVVFSATLPDGSGGIFVGPNPATDTVTTTAFNAPQLGPYVIDNHANVAYQQEFNSGRRGIFLYDRSTGATTTIAESTTFAGTTTGPFANFFDVDVNDNGDVVFAAALVNGTQGLFTGGDPLTDTFVDSTGPYADEFSNAFPRINNAGTIIFNQAVEGDAPRRGIFSGPDPATDTVVDDTGPYATFGTRASLNHLGTLLFNAVTDSGLDGLFTGPDPATDTVVDAAGPYRAFLSYAFNNVGGFAFYAGLDDTSEIGLYSGLDPIENKVVEVGDVLFGSTVTDINIGSNHSDFLNDRGQVAFHYQLADGREGIAIATIIPLPAALPAGLAMLLPLGAKWAWHRRRRRMH